ncbi:MAG: phytoene/squalene synthase family protein [Acidobacteria bacterium]|nr:phytoene/squalene synthase family protein [Acidobacteriota bacterium]
MGAALSVEGDGCSVGGLSGLRKPGFQVIRSLLSPGTSCRNSLFSVRSQGIGIDMAASHLDSSDSDDLAFQAEMLKGVARTFALTIAQLPRNLHEAVGNAYLLCRIADTIEDEPALSLERKQAFSERFIEIVAGRDDPASFAGELGPLLSSSTGSAAGRLVANTPRVIGLTRRLNLAQRKALHRCVGIMSRGMVEFQRSASTEGLRDVAQLNRYCYHVAGVVGETLTALFCDHSEEIDKRREDLLPLSVSFGQGLQMINILKDLWEDRSRGVCWLPRDVFRRAGIDLRSLSPGMADPGFAEGLLELVAMTRDHLANGLRFIGNLPTRETGIRRSCLWPLAFAVLTLRRISRKPTFSSGREVTVSRRGIWAAALLTSVLARSNLALNLLFKLFTWGLPKSSAA